MIHKFFFTFFFDVAIRNCELLQKSDVGVVNITFYVIFFLFDLSWWLDGCNFDHSMWLSSEFFLNYREPSKLLDSQRKFCIGLNVPFCRMTIHQPLLKSVVVYCGACISYNKFLCHHFLYIIIKQDLFLVLCIVCCLIKINIRFMYIFPADGWHIQKR